MKLSFKFGGKIRALRFDDNERVKKGAILAELDTVELLAQREKARESLKKAERDLARMEKLQSRNIISLSSSQDARSTAILASAELKMVEDRLKHARIRAPFTGRIREKRAEALEVVGSGVPVAVLTRMDPIVVKITVADHDLQKVKTGSGVSIHVDTYPQEVFRGCIRRVDTSADPLSRTFRAEILVQNPDEKLRPGQIARVTLVNPDLEPAVFLPMDCILGFGEAPYVYVVKGKKAFRRPVRIGRILEGDVEILKGVSPGDRIVISGQEYLTHGLSVRAANESSRPGLPES
jgi:membrane fusion protein (multidrug efflux system)